MPVVVYAASKLSHGGMINRYAVPAVLAYPLGVGFILPRLTRRSVMLLAIFVFVVVAARDEAFWAMHRNHLAGVTSVSYTHLLHLWLPSFIGHRGAKSKVQVCGTRTERDSRLPDGAIRHDFGSGGLRLLSTKENRMGPSPRASHCGHRSERWRNRARARADSAGPDHLLRALSLIHI